MGTRTRMVYTMINTAPVVQQRHRAHAASVRVGGMRRKVKRVPNNSSYDDKRLQLALQKLALQKISEVQEASLTKSDGAVVRLTVADVSVSVSSNTCVINTKAVNVQPEAEAPTAATPEDEVTEVVAEGGDEKDTTEEEATVQDDEQQPAADTEAPAADKHKPNKAEKKIRKLLTSHGLKPNDEYVEMKVTTKKGITLVIQNPDTLKAPKGNVLACLGKIKMEDTTEAQARKLMEQIQAAQPAQAGADDSDDEDCPDLAEVTFDSVEQGDGELEVGDLSEEDVQLVVTQSKVSKARAITALNENGGDVVNAIMSLAE